ncbi:hypothetical protein PMI04_015185 [Sphingobium sp. AP49]|uniref:hypothetical protein n=1 Tax=Sphingobium sp. AP49 TaxID=1144307 RepID=UPI00026ED986|nr:hypothetical protein [Sphingobium sp. AP49]WHO37902.1 hypothetical protein PMI04_015185 [Sphingobium sp. AP49]
MIPLASLLLIAGGALGAALLRRSWLRRDRSVPALLLAGWTVLVGLLVAAFLLVGPVKGLALGLVMEAIGALALIWFGRVRRKAGRVRAGDVAPEPLEEPGRFWRGVLRALLAGPLGMTAAMGVAFCLTVYMPGDPRTRIVLGGMLLPILWGLAMTWTLADRRLLRATAVLVGTSIVGFGLAALGGAA